MSRSGNRYSAAARAFVNEIRAEFGLPPIKRMPANRLPRGAKRVETCPIATALLQIPAVTYARVEPTRATIVTETTERKLPLPKPVSKYIIEADVAA